MKNHKLLEHQFVFVVGLPRSGTTLVQSLIATHNNVHTFPETHLFRILSNLKVDVDSIITTDKFKALITYLSEKIPNISQKIDFEIIANQAKFKVKDIVTLLLIELAKVWSDNVIREGDIILEKTPGHFLDVSQIQSLYPDSKFIHVVRNPLENIASIQTSFNKMMPLLARIRFWKWCNQLIREFSRIKNNVHVVVYNNLIVDRNKEVERIGSFLGIKFNEDDLDKFEKQYEEVSLNYENWKIISKSKCITDNRHKWKKILKPSEAWFIELFLKRDYVFYNLKEHNIRIDIISKCSIVIQELFKYLFYKLKGSVKD